jgi:exosortase family protein XrtF
MKWSVDFIRENKNALRFLLVFIGFYLALNLSYRFYLQYYAPTSDPFTRWIGRQVVGCLSVFDSHVQGFPSGYNEYIAIANAEDNQIYVYEEFNGVSAFIVYISFLVAFWRSWRMLLKFTAIGLVVIHLFNLLRIGLLFGVASHFGEYPYFVHKYLFTGFIYVVVFMLWYFWVRKGSDEAVKV